MLVKVSFATTSYLGMSKLVLGMIHINGTEKLLWSFLVVNELTFGDDTGIQYFVSKKQNIVLTLIVDWFVSVDICISWYVIADMTKINNQA